MKKKDIVIGEIYAFGSARNYWGFQALKMGKVLDFGWTRSSWGVRTVGEMGVSHTKDAKLVLVAYSADDNIDTLKSFDFEDYQQKMAKVRELYMESSIEAKNRMYSRKKDYEPDKFIALTTVPLSQIQLPWSEYPARRAEERKKYEEQASIDNAEFRENQARQKAVIQTLREKGITGVSHSRDFVLVSIADLEKFFTQ